MKEIKRILSLVLCLAMIVGMLPMFVLNAAATTDDLSAPADTTPVVDSIKAVSNQDVYCVGQELDITVYEVYTNGDEVPVEGFTISGFDSNVLGTQDVIITYGDYTTSVSVNVAEQEDTEPVLVNEDISTFVAERGTDEEVSSVTGTGTVPGEPKTVYVLSNGNPSGDVLIASSNSAGAVNLVAYKSYSLSNVATKVIYGDCDGDGNSENYIELTDTEATNALWTVVGSYAFKNQNRYLRYNNGLSVSSNSTTWSYSSSSNRLSYKPNGSDSTYYLRHNNGWTTTDDSGEATSIYFYTPYEFSTSTTIEGTFSIKGDDFTRVVTSKGGEATVLAELICTPNNSEEYITVDVADTYVIYSDPDGIIVANSLKNNGDFTFSGKLGTAVVKASATVTVDGEEKTVIGYITVTADVPSYTLEIEQGESYTHKGVQNGQTLDLNAVLTEEDEEGSYTVANPTLTWTIESGSHLATINASTGVLTFNGKEGDMEVKVSYKVDDNTTLAAYIDIQTQKTSAITPGESTTDFPRWPHEGAVRFDKTAQAVGKFSNTGVAEMELSLAGIPQKTGGAVDVVLVLDASGSMTKTRIAASIAAAKEFAEQICYTDGKPNKNRIAIVYFGNSTHYPVQYSDLGNSTTYGYKLATASGEWDESALYKCINEYCGKTSEGALSGGTKYQEALSVANQILIDAKKDGTGNNRSQYLLFMTDGSPTEYTYASNYAEVQAGTADTYTPVKVTGQDKNNASSTTAGRYEYYTACMKQRGVTVYTVGTALTKSSNANSVEFLRKMATDDAKAYAVSESDVNSGKLANAFKTIAEEINQAATNIEVTDKITEEYEMIFKWPDLVTEANKVSGQEFYVEVVNYALDATTHERTGAYDVLTRIYLKEDGAGNLSIDGLVEIKNGTTNDLSWTPVYTAVSEGQKGFFNYDSEERTYVYVADGSGSHKMTEGATVTGTADTVELHTPYFSYKASDKIITWHVAETTDNAEIALRYFLYLINSLESANGTYQEGDPEYVESMSYPTNDYATLEYINYLDHEVMQYFPVPQLTWNGAQVHYVFYLVNTDGVPVNTAGREVTFTEAVFVTDIFTDAVVWNSDNPDDNFLNAEKIAKDLLPTGYTLYDNDATYKVHVFEDETGKDLGNYFIIGDTTKVDSKGNSSTKVYNTKSGTKYAVPGTYASQNIKNEDNVEVLSNFDFANTTVAFAVVWEKKLVADTVVVDYGLPVDINVTGNDFVYNSITAIGTETPVDTTSSDKKPVAMNTGTYTYMEKSPMSYMVGNDGKSGVLEIGAHTAQVINENVIRFTPGSMNFNAPVDFHYETSTDFYANGAVEKAYMYSKVTVIPATTIYYEDDFLSLNSFSKNGDTWPTVADNPTKWTYEGTMIGATQAQDRPGESKISAALDADNNYGYDAAYESMSKHSLGSSAKISVDANTRGEATFTFWGTGFDVISTTSNASGTLTVQVYEGSEVTGTAVKTSIVDTYYGYTKNEAGEWVASDSDDGNNALYQVPVMKIFGLPYKQYTVKITAGWNSFFDHMEGSTSYDLYLDAIRIYDPTGNQNTTANNAYIADGEAWPLYKELRNLIINANSFGENVTVESGEYSAETVVTGIVFIDGKDKDISIKDYTSYGPNNELYLAAGQSIAFNINDAFVDSNSKIITPVDVQLAIKTVGGAANIEIFNPGLKTTTTTSEDGKTETTTVSATKDNLISEEINSATDMYYSIKKLTDGTIVISNPGTSGIISITNIKFTFDKAATVKTKTTTNEETGEEVTNEVSVASISEQGVVFAMRSLSAYSVSVTEEIEVPETEVTEPEIEPVKPDNSNLKAAVDAAKQLKQNDYTKESYEAVKTALKAAEKVLKDENATQAQIDEALENLNEAVEALETKVTKPVKPDNSNLKSAVEAAKKLKQNDYTKESYEAVKSALKDAEKVLNNKNATQAQIDNALENLNMAVNALETKPTASKPGQNNKPGNAGNNNSTIEQQVNQIIVQISNLLFGWLFN